MRKLSLTPPEQPLAMPEQDFGAHFHDAACPGTSTSTSTTQIDSSTAQASVTVTRQVALWRVLAFSPAMAATGLLTWGMKDWFAADGFSTLEIALLVLIAFNFFWICFSVSTVLLGLWGLSRRPQALRKGRPQRLKVALLMPVFNEVPWYVLGNAQSMLEELHDRGGVHDYAMFILSDTRDDAIAAQERASVEALRAMLPTGAQLYYRRRNDNEGRKVGNIADWVRRWGAGWDAMLVLDADSLMTGRAIAHLADALARDSGAGLIQSYPQLIGAQSVFGRMQQFANGVYGLALAEGLARWAGHEGNYWGHNAIIRTRAFAACAGLPPLRSVFGGEKLIMSHDFVEAGLLRRAGWGVQFLPRIRGSYEETPQTLIDHVLRDRRWCQGNLQHLGLLNAKGFRALSRFHLLHGAIGYLMAPVWFALLVIWALIGRGEEASVLTYFSETNPLMPSWPDMSEPRHVLVILLIYAMLLAPKLLAVAALPMTGSRFSEYGGAAAFALSLLTEILLAILYAPILMVQQMIAVIRTALGLQKGWSPQARDGGTYSWRTLATCHALETISGIALWTGILAGVVSIWLLPIAVSLILAVPLSALSGMPLQRFTKALLATREVNAEPRITRIARARRHSLKMVLETASARQTPAE